MSSSGSGLRSSEIAKLTLRSRQCFPVTQRKQLKSGERLRREDLSPRFTILRSCSTWPQWIGQFISSKNVRFRGVLRRGQRLLATIFRSLGKSGRNGGDLGLHEGSSEVNGRRGAHHWLYPTDAGRTSHGSRRVNAEAALAFAEKGVMEWAEYHVRLMNETHQGLDDVEATAELILEPTRKRVRQYVDSAEQKTSGNRAKGAELAMQLVVKCKPSMAIYDLFHGKEAHQRADLFDEVAGCAASLAIGYQLETGDNIEFVKVLNAALDFANGASVREKIIHNISIGKNNLDSKKFQPIFDSLKSVSESKQNPVQKLSRVKAEILPSCLAGSYGRKSF